MSVGKNIKERPSGLSITSLTTGVLSLVPLGPGLLLGLAAIICGTMELCWAKGKGYYTRSKGVDVLGITFGAVGLVGTFIVIVYSMIVIISKYGIESWL